MQQHCSCSRSAASWSGLAALGVFLALSAGAPADSTTSTSATGQARGQGFSLQQVAGAPEAGRRHMLGGCPVSVCDGVNCTLTQSLDLITDGGNQVACGAAGNTTENGWARCYDLCEEGVTAGGPLTVTSVTFGVQQATVDGILVDVVIYRDTDGCPPNEPGVDAIEVARESLVINMADVGTMITVAIDPAAVIPAGEHLVVEVENLEDGTEVVPAFAFRTMSNANGQCGPSYLRAADCSAGANIWDDLAALGFPDAHLIQIVEATEGGTPTVCGDGSVDGCEECEPPNEGLCGPDCTFLPNGACCTAGVCSQDTQAGCLAGGGCYNGDDTSCGDIDCAAAGCGVVGTGSCEQANCTPGCEDLDCCNAVCAVDPFCCDVQWDQNCANAAIQLCFVEPACGVEDTGNCFVANGSPFCDDFCDADPCTGCCENVCSFDAFCCDTEWDGFCVSEAMDVCGCSELDIPPNDECLAATVLPTLGTYDVTNVCANAGIPRHPVCWDGFSLGLGLDVWFQITVDYTGDLVASTCNQIDWNSIIAIYEGCDCAAIEALDGVGEPLGCNDDGAGCGAGSSLAIAPVVAGNCYTVRVGGSYLDTSGAGFLTLSDQIPEPCVLDIPPDVTLVEPDPCGPEDPDPDPNGGCNNDPGLEMFTRVACGEVVHGTAYADAGIRDTDWYELVLTEDTEVTLTVETEFAFLMGFVETNTPGSGDCADGTGFVNPAETGPPCLETSIGPLLLTPGTYWPFVATDGFEGVPCGPMGNNYILRIDCPAACPPPCPGDTNDSGDVNVTDLVNVILAWGPCPGCPADTNCDDEVNVTDLVNVIMAWGPCP